MSWRTLQEELVVVAEVFMDTVGTGRFACGTCLGLAPGGVITHRQVSLVLNGISKIHYDK